MSHVTRIISDIHYGDRASRARQLSQLRPLFADIDALVLNGDTIDTRPGPHPAFTDQLRRDVVDFFPREVKSVTLLTGNHDADISTNHSLALAGGRVFAVHGDILWDNIVPWSADAAAIGGFITEGLNQLPASRRDELTSRLAVWRIAAGRIPQRHQSERAGLKYALGFASDTFWPPMRVLRILRAWREERHRAADFLRRHRPETRLMVTGHTHRPGWWRLPAGGILVNTGSFCAPFGGYAVDVGTERAQVRRIDWQNDEFRPGRVLVEFPLAES